MKHQRFVILTFVVAAVLVGMVVQSAAVSGFAEFGLSDDRLLGGLVNTSSLLAAASGVVALAALFRNQPAVRFTDEVIAELVKVTWPTRDETVRATTTVVFTTLFVAALLGLYDLLWKNLADLVLFTEG